MLSGSGWDAESNAGIFAMHDAVHVRNKGRRAPTAENASSWKVSVLLAVWNKIPQFRSTAERSLPTIYPEPRSSCGGAFNSELRDSQVFKATITDEIIDFINKRLKRHVNIPRELDTSVTVVCLSHFGSSHFGSRTW